MRTQILEILIQKHERTAGHCGTRVAEISNQLNEPFKEVRKILVQMFKDRIITAHPGAQGELLKIVK